MHRKPGAFAHLKSAFHTPSPSSWALSAPSPPFQTQNGCCSLPSILVGHALLLTCPAWAQVGRVGVGATAVGTAGDSLVVSSRGPGYPGTKATIPGTAGPKKGEMDFPAPGGPHTLCSQPRVLNTCKGALDVCDHVEKQGPIRKSRRGEQFVSGSIKGQRNPHRYGRERPKPNSSPKPSALCGAVLLHL